MHEDRVWGMAHRAWGDDNALGKGKREKVKGGIFLFPLALYPLPFAPCPIPNALSEKSDFRLATIIKFQVYSIKIVYSVYHHESFCAFLAASFFTHFGSRV